MLDGISVWKGFIFLLSSQTSISIDARFICVFTETGLFSQSRFSYLAYAVSSYTASLH
jgi:hypothetical protein